MKNSIKGFSFIELITALSIIILLSVIGTTAYSSMQQKSDNSKVVSDLKSITNSLSNYKEEKNTLPLPSGNKSFYKEDTSYAHSYEEAFGVSGFITENTIDKKYLNYLPIDPKTFQYYAYAKTKKYLSYEIAGVIYEDDNPKSIVVGNWGGEVGPYNLVKEYAGPNFVFDGSTTYFPYNPYEKKLVAKINSFSGNLIINSKTISVNDLKELTLGAGDKILVGTGGSVNLYYSDGSNSILGDKNSQTEVVLANLSFKDNSNLVSSIKLALNMGSIWTKASKLDNNSDFEIYTPDQVAAVRGTIFGLSKNTTASNITVINGKVEVSKILNKENLIQNISNSQVETQILELPGTTTTSSGKTYIEVKSGESAKGISSYITNGTQNPLYNYQSTGSILNIPDNVKSQVINGDGIINENLQLKLESFNSTTKTLKLSINDTLKKASNMVINGISYGNWTNYLTGNYLILTNNIISNIPTLKIKLCDNLDNCSKEFSFDTTGGVSVENANISLPIDCGEGFKYFEKGGCVENSLYNSGFKLVGYSSLADQSSLYLDIDGDKIANNGSGNIFSAGNNYFNTGANIKYNLSKLGFNSDDYFGLEFEIRGSDLKNNFTGNFLYYLSGTTNLQNTLMSTGSNNIKLAVGQGNLTYSIPNISENKTYKLLVYTTENNTNSNNYIYNIMIDGVLINTGNYNKVIPNIITIGSNSIGGRPWDGEIKNFKIYKK